MLGPVVGACVRPAYRASREKVPRILQLINKRSRTWHYSGPGEVQSALLMAARKRHYFRITWRIQHRIITIDSLQYMEPYRV